MNFYVDRRSKVPVFEQIELIMRKLITQGNWGFEREIPPMDELKKLFNAEKSDIEKALKSLESDGILKHQNHAWLVSYGRIPSMWINEFSSIVEMTRIMGYEPRIETLKFKKVAKPDLKEFPESEALYIQRVYYGDDLPLFVVETYLPYQRFHAMEAFMKENTAYYPIFQKEYGIELKSFKRSLMAINFDAETCKLLNLHPKAVGLYSPILTYDQNGQLIEFAKTYTASERMHFVLEI